MNPVVVAFLALALWPLVVISLIVALFAAAVLIHFPRIYGEYGFTATAIGRRLLLVLVVAFIGVVAGTALVAQAPSTDFPKSLDAKPVALIGLWLASWSTFGFVMTSELTARTARRLEEVSLDDVLCADLVGNGRTNPTARIQSQV